MLQCSEVPVDVRTEVVINRPPREVAAYASDPDNATAWYENIKSVEWKSPKPLSVGSRVDFVEGPFPMETTYTWQETSTGDTKMALRNRGEPSGFSKLAAPMLASAMRRANRKDLARLKALLESRADPSA